MNAKDELIKHIKLRNVIYVQIKYDIDHTYEYTKIIEGTLDNVLPQLDFDYDNSYGTQYIKGTIWYSDGTWSERCEYDGSEWWEYRKCPSLPLNNPTPIQPTLP